MKPQLDESEERILRHLEWLEECANRCAESVVHRNEHYHSMSVAFRTAAVDIRNGFHRGVVGSGQDVG